MKIVKKILSVLNEYKYPIIIGTVIGLFLQLAIYQNWIASDCNADGNKTITTNNNTKKYSFKACMLIIRTSKMEKVPPPEIEKIPVVAVEQIKKEMKKKKKGAAK